MKFEKSLKVLVAEDNIINQMCANVLLTRLQCTTDFANNGKEAVNYASKEKYDIILMDLQMPEMTGLEATAIIRNEDRSIPIIAFTANEYSEDIDRCLKAGMNDLLEKPYTEEKLFEMMKKWI